MRNLLDWHKEIEMKAKAAQRAREIAARTAPAREPEIREELAAAPSGPPRKGRGPRKQESREDLIARLLDPKLSLEETAKMLEVCPTTVRRYTNKGVLPCERTAGNQRQFRLSTVLAFLDERERGGLPDDQD